MFPTEQSQFRSAQMIDRVRHNRVVVMDEDSNVYSLRSSEMPPDRDLRIKRALRRQHILAIAAGLIIMGAFLGGVWLAGGLQ